MPDLKGFFLIDKPKGVTSFDVVQEVRRAFGIKKVGHSGTLDPLATGLLLVAVGEGTKLLEFLIGCDKEYEVSAHFGAVSDTYDAEGSITRGDFLVFDEEAVRVAIDADFSGEIFQIPPKFSALKIGGKRACDRVRDGEEVEMKARKVRIDEFSVLGFDWPVVRFRVRCGSGTYIRSLVHDLGQKLGCGGYVEELRRTKVGNFKIDDAVGLDDLCEQKIVSIERGAACFDSWVLEPEQFAAMKDGRVLVGKKIEQGDFAAAFFEDCLVGVLENCDGGVKYRKVIH